MGRAQGLHDSFTSVFGEGRGLRLEQEALSTAPAAPTVASDDQTEVVRRQMKLLSWLLDRQEQMAPVGSGKETFYTNPKHAIVCSGIYSQKTVAAQESEESCLADLEALVRQGLLVKEESTEQGGLMIYTPVMMRYWSPQQRASYEIWKQCK
jgi:hypothetical protein